MKARVDAIFTMDPFVFPRWGAACLAHRNGPVRLTPITLFHSSIERCSSGRFADIPALFIRISVRPCIADHSFIYQFPDLLFTGHVNGDELDPADVSVLLGCFLSRLPVVVRYDRYASLFKECFRYRLAYSLVRLR